MEIFNNYSAFISQLKKEVENARLQASLTVNKQLLILYWRIGKMILEQQENEGGVRTKVIDRLSSDLRKAWTTRFLRGHLVYRKCLH